jgi:predicted acylesterase/phospholipase RssA
MISKYEDLILSGGSVRGYYQLGVLYKHEEEISSVTRYVGTSVGAIISLLLVCGYTVNEIMRAALDVKWNLPSSMEGVIQTLSEFMSHYGLLSANPYIEKLESMLTSKYGYIPTLKQLYELTGKELLIVTSCVTRHEMVVLSRVTHPDLPCTLAVDMSSRIPLIFSPIEYQNELYIDGGVCDHFPIRMRNKHNKTLAICISEHREYGDGISIYQYMNSIVSTAMHYRYHDEDLYEEPDNLTLYNLEGICPTMLVETKTACAMFIIGFLAMKRSFTLQ